MHCAEFKKMKTLVILFYNNILKMNVLFSKSITK